MQLALYEPDIPQNAAALIRLGACLGVPVDIIEPCGFLFSDTRFRRAGMDYIGLADVQRHDSWVSFAAQQKETGRRTVLLTTKSAFPYTDFAFEGRDTILLGSESAGVPRQVHDSVDARLKIPMLPGLRSINVAQAGAMVLSEALRQTGMFPA